MRGIIQVKHASQQHVHLEVSNYLIIHLNLLYFHGLITCFPTSRALVFAAALILGFDMFSKREVDNEIETAFSGAREILDMLSAQSPQAAHYFEILSMLSNAIAKRRKQFALRGRSKYVGRLFTLDGANTTEDNQERAEPLASDSLEAHPQPVVLNDDGENWTQGCQQTQPDLDEGLLLRWDSLDLPLWDSFPFINGRSFEAS